MSADTQARLADFGAGGRVFVEPAVVAAMLPHEVDGLGPLNCGRCGERAIYDHPCDACGFDPRDGGGG